MKPFLTISAALILACGVALADTNAKNAAAKAGSATEGALGTAGNATEKGMKAAGGGAEKGLEATGKGVGVAVEQTTKGSVTAGKATAKAMEKTAGAVSDFFTDDADTPQENPDRDKNHIMAAQRALRNKGYYGGPIDGIIGPKTRSGLSKYQGDSDIKLTGKLDAPTAKKLGILD